MTDQRGTTLAGRRASLLARMSGEARETGVVPRRIHLVVAIDRLLVRLLAAAPGAWVVKGGYANQLTERTRRIVRRSGRAGWGSVIDGIRVSLPTSRNARRGRSRW